MADDDEEWLRLAADRLGLSVDDSRHAEQIESADAFLARMKREFGREAPDRRRRTKAIVVGSGLLAAAVAGALVVMIPATNRPADADTPALLDYSLADGSDVASAAGRPAAGELRELARIARAAPAPPRGGDTQEVVTSGWFAQIESAAESSSARFTPMVQESRLAADGALVVVSQKGRQLTSAGHLVQGVVQAPHSADRVPPGSFDPHRALELGTDVSGVRRALLHNGGCESRQRAAVTACLYREISALHHQWVVPPALAATLWEILAGQGDVRLLGTVDDRAGRPGVGFAIDIPGPPALRKILIVSRDDGRLLGTEEVLTADDVATGVAAPAVYSFTAILSARWIAQK